MGLSTGALKLTASLKSSSELQLTEPSLLGEATKRKDKRNAGSETLRSPLAGPGRLPRSGGFGIPYSAL